MAGRGRPTSLTPEVMRVIVEAVEGGNYRSTAAAAAGVHRNRMAEWEKRGEAGEEPYAKFACALQMAEAKAEMTLLRELRAAQPGVPVDIDWAPGTREFRPEPAKKGKR